MKNDEISQLFSSSLKLENVGLKTLEALKKINCHRIIDLIWHVPSGLINKQLNPDLKTVESGTHIVTSVIIDSIDNNKFGKNRHKPFKIYTYNNTGYIELIFFNFYLQQSRRIFI